MKTMRRATLELIILCVGFSLVISGCQIFPYVYTPTGANTQLPPVDTPTPLAPAQGTAGEDQEFTLQKTPTPTKTALIEPPISSPTHQLGDPMNDRVFLPLTLRTWPAPFNRQEGTPLYAPQFSHPEAGCDWAGVGGQVFDSTGEPLETMVVLVGGEIEGQYVEFATLTGLAPAYGPGGYEVRIAERPFESQDAFWVELYDLAGHSLSERVYFNTLANCNENLVLINFTRNQPAAEAKSGNGQRTPTPAAYPYP
jgi:hypothetical protein